MKKLKWIISDKLGLHARPAGELVRMANEFASSIILESGGKRASAKNILEVMELDAGYETEIVVTVEGEDEEQAWENLAVFSESMQ